MTEHSPPPRLILHDIRSAYNVGAIMRTADAIGGARIVCCGITPHPEVAGDNRSPVVIDSNTRSIAKTALGAEQSLTVDYEPDVRDAIAAARAAGCIVLALEQHASSVNLFEFTVAPDRPYALVVGPEVDGIDDTIIALADSVLEIPQYGSKESLNVSVAAGITLYSLFADLR